MHMQCTFTILYLKLRNNTNLLFFTQISIYEILNEVRNSKSKSSTDFIDLSMFTIKEIIL